MQKFVVIFQAPVPVGHRVELTWYDLVDAGFFGGTNRKTRPHEPVVTDLDTGIVYLSDRVLDTPGMKSPDTPYGVSDAISKIATQVKSVRGIVRACRVVTIRSFAEIDLQTELTIEPQG
ncbi:hypothetical protein [Nannocystis radixulma]|uniref:Uncharacterized protein n=1 Tax=Nannocystis radixulma TaxID=2995305 RepID=A0ABT5B1T2_9BACT|nr:hypothetical protein [Nannocystis radixulma]MDC0668051.1 hypothetical protein [Nannocystis radixulma]